MSFNSSTRLVTCGGLFSFRKNFHGGGSTTAYEGDRFQGDKEAEPGLQIIAHFGNFTIHAFIRPSRLC